MMRMDTVQAHGGQGALAEKIVMPRRIEAVLRGTTGTIRVWEGHGEAEEFTLDEARSLCVAVDDALTGPFSDGRAFLTLHSGVNEASELCIKRGWLIAFAAALRRAMRTHDAAVAMSRAATCIDDESDPGSWEEHLSLTATMRGAH